MQACAGEQCTGAKGKAGAVRPQRGNGALETQDGHPRAGLDGLQGPVQRGEAGKPCSKGLKRKDETHSPP